MIFANYKDHISHKSCLGYKRLINQKNCISHENIEIIKVVQIMKKVIGTVLS